MTFQINLFLFFKNSKQNKKKAKNKNDKINAILNLIVLSILALGKMNRLDASIFGTICLFIPLNIN